jgi:phosphatidylglycerol:prolipoprotein diacylglycerol transferase
MYPETLFSILGVDVNPYVLAYPAGLLASLALSLCLARARQVPTQTFIDAWFVGVVAAFIGARLYFAICFLSTYLLQDRALTWRILSRPGLSSMGGIVLTVAALWRFATVHPAGRVRSGDVLDITAVAAAACLSIGRLGCFWVGCCHGRPAFGLPWAVVFSNPRAASLFKGIPVHPTQLYLAGGEALVVVLLLVLFHQARCRGVLFPVYLCAHGALRFTVEFYRGDERSMVGALSLNQVLCVGLVLTGALLLWGRHSRARWCSALTRFGPGVAPQPAVHREDPGTTSLTNP